MGGGEAPTPPSRLRLFLIRPTAPYAGPCPTLFLPDPTTQTHFTFGFGLPLFTVRPQITEITVCVLSLGLGFGVPST